MPYLEDYRTRKIRVLHAEDDLIDSELISDQLSDSGMDVEYRRIDDEGALAQELKEFRPDIVLSDLAMPGFTGYRALELVRAHSRYVPFIFVSGTMGEDAAVKALREGATDYILKQNAARLVPAVERALREAHDRIVQDRTETELLRSQRMESLALLASGLSHDLRNILQPLLMVAPLISERSDDERLHRLGELVEDCAKRGLDMVASMLSFARGSRRSTGQVRVDQLVRALELLLQGTLPRSIRLILEPVDSDLAFEGNETELQQCLLNLALNAIQAMPEGGSLTLAAREVELEQALKLRSSTLSPGRYLCLSVTDTGVGMSDDVQQRLFTPFFTTKADGTGLGLMSCKRIVENHRGALRLQSAPGKGTRFELYLPLRATATDEIALPAVVRSDARILLVAEEAGSLTLMHDALLLKGYLTDTAVGGAAALRTIETDGLPDLLLLDSDMRLLSSVRILAELQQRQFAGSVLLMVDAAHPPTPDELPPDLRIALLHKPIDMPALLAAVHRALAATP